jgi:alpha-beta hydrolase superfamily lysophospholipase
VRPPPRGLAGPGDGQTLPMARDWQPDVLGQGFEAATLTLTPDDEGQVVATVVRAPAPAVGHGGAVLYVHGYNDYFFQVDLARWYTERGWAFYALDLRKYGRSLREGQTPNLCRSLADYDEELDATVRLITEEGHDRLLLAAHSTGGLILPLWAARRPALEPSLVGLVLNSPFLAFKQSPLLDAVTRPVFAVVAKREPSRVLPVGVSGWYGQSLHVTSHGEWDYNLNWKPIDSFPVRIGWLAAVGQGHRRLHAGLELGAPVLCLSSTRTVGGSAWSPEFHRGDAVLDAGRIARWAPALGRNVTVTRVTDGMHDLFLSLPHARQEAYATLGTWLGAWVGQ